MIGLEDFSELMDEAPDLHDDPQRVVEVDVVRAGDLFKPEVRICGAEVFPGEKEKDEK